MDVVKDMKNTLAKEIEGAAKEADEQQLSTSMRVPSHSRKHEHDQIQAMLQHQADLLEATIARLHTVGITLPSVSSDGST